MITSLGAVRLAGIGRVTFHHFRHSFCTFIMAEAPMRTRDEKGKQLKDATQVTTSVLEYQAVHSCVNSEGAIVAVASHQVL